MWLSAERWCWGALELGHQESVLGTEISPIASVLSLVSPHQPAWPLQWGRPFSWGPRAGFPVPEAATSRQVWQECRGRPSPVQPRASLCLSERLPFLESWALQGPQVAGEVTGGFLGSRESWEGHVTDAWQG